MANQQKQQTLDKMFQNAWKAKTEQRNKQKLKVESDSDSDTEQQKQQTKKKMRVKRNKKQRTQQASFPEITRTREKQVVVNEKNYPEIFACDRLPNMPKPEKLFAEQRFFQKKNNCVRQNLSEMSPKSFPMFAYSMHEPPKGTFNIHAVNKRDNLRPQMEPVTREYEEKYLVEPQEALGEKQCLNGRDCQGLKINCQNPFICKEFFLPSQEKKKVGNMRRMCLLCVRNEIAIMVFTTRAEGKSISRGNTLQDYYNLVDLPGEYTTSSCLCSDPSTYEGLLEPIVRHQLSSYQMKVNENGLRYYDQWNMPYPSHFQ